MALETGNFIDDLVDTNPVSATDLVRFGAPHIRLIKEVLQNSFSGSIGAIIAAGVDVGAVNAIVITPVTPLLEYTPRMMIVWLQGVTNTGATTINISGLGAKSVVSVGNAALASGDLVAGRVYVGIYDGTSVQLAAVTKNYVDQQVFLSVLPDQAGNSGKVVTTDGTTASWTSKLLAGTMRFADSTDNTKQIAFNASGITTATTRTITMPDNDVLLTGGLTISTRTSNTILAASDIAKLIDITSGTFTQTFTSAGSLPIGWFVYIRNSGTGLITIPSSDGVSNWIMYPGEVRLFAINGSSFYSLVLASFSYVPISSGNFVIPPGYDDLDIEGWGGGGGGGSGRRGASGTIRGGGTGGGGGGYKRKLLKVSDIGGPGASISYAIAAGGTGGAAITSNNTSGNSGVTAGNTTFGTFFTAYGGTGGSGGGDSPLAGPPGGGSLPNAAPDDGAAPGSNGARGFGGARSNSASAYSSGYGGGSGAPSGNSNTIVAAGGGSAYGGAGGAAGGDVSNTNTLSNGGDGGSQDFATGGGAAGGTSHPTTPTVGSNGSAFKGGGGGGSSDGADAAAGGDGGIASGGGGGGGTLNGNNSGAGGTGGDGYLIIRGV